MVLSDFSKKALKVAAENVQKNGVGVELIHGDLCDPFQGRKTDILFCNPPYISPKEYLTLDRSVKDFEPKEALIAEENGYAFYKRLSRELPPYLNPQAKLYFEIGTGQGNLLLELFSGPMWKNVRVEKDWAGHERLLFP